MNSLEENTFIIETNFRSGRLENEKWQYSIQECKEQFRRKYTDKNVVLHHHIHQLNKKDV